MLALQRVKQIFRYLKEFVELGQPRILSIDQQLWKLRLSELPIHQAIEVGEVQLARPNDSAVTGKDAGNDAPLLRVQRPETTRAIEPPASLREWVVSGWEDPDATLTVLPERNVPQDRGTATERFGDDQERVRAFENWQARWERWAVIERPARAAMHIFERLYELRGRIGLASESCELMVGDGRLRWSTRAGEIDHPILLQRVELEFDPDVPEIRVVDADRSPELYGPILYDEQGTLADVINQMRNELEQGSYHPLSKDITSAFLRRLVCQLNSRGTFLDEPSTGVAGQYPVLSREPVLFLRSRDSGYGGAIERVLAGLESADNLPPALMRLTGVTPPAVSDELSPPLSPWGEPPDVLLSKAANFEQVEIARALERHKAVLVQGPPGTGKSHTIANLIGHLVANGNRVLVTSHTTKALRVLRGQLVESLQPLCVAVLDNDLEARTQMEQSVRGILSRLTTVHEETLAAEVVRLEAGRKELNAHIEKITNELRKAREAEYLPILLGGESVTPSDAARFVQGNAEGNDWIPGPVETGAPLPISPDETSELYGINARLSGNEEGEIDEDLVDPSGLPDAAEFRVLVEALDGSEPRELAVFWSEGPSPAALENLESLARILASKAESLASLEQWQRQVVAAGHAGGTESELWTSLREQVREALRGWEKARPLLIDREFTIDAAADRDKTLLSLQEIGAHLKRGGTLNWLTLLFNAGWKTAIRCNTVDSHAPRTASDVKDLHAYVSVESHRRRLGSRWDRLAKPTGLPSMASFHNPPEPAMEEYAGQFESLLVWWSANWAVVAAALDLAGFKWIDFRRNAVAKSGPTTAFERDAALLAGDLQSVVACRLAAARRENALVKIQAMVAQVEPHRGAIGRGLLAAITSRDPVEYENARNALLDLIVKVTLWKRRKELLQRMAPVAPEWARKIMNREGVHGESRVPGDVRIAWRWRQLGQEINHRSELDEITLADKVHQMRGELRDMTGKLIDRRAWLEQLRRTDLTARQALQGWADTQKKIGRGTGKRVPELQAKSRELLAKARNAVPVWIMPMSRVAESFDPKKGLFDVVIIDEASQSDVTGLLCWYLADRIAVVGDHEQVSPLAVGQQVAPVSVLINKHLGGIPNSHLYDGTTSIYHLARQCFGGTIALREHFRCVPDIIEFSNRLCYDGEIRPLRNAASTPKPHVVEYMVDAGADADRTGKINKAEARTIAALVKAAGEIDAYRDKTFGAITLLGDEQASLIQDLTVSLVGAVDLERRRFASGNAAQFQGDERNVIFLSMVDTPKGRPLFLRQTDLLKQRYNVASSRAKDQMWLIHSLDPGRDLRAGDLRKALIEHVRAPSARPMAAAAAQRRTESPLEAEVIGRLILAGYRVEPQVWVGRYRIDMVISDGIRQVALECDGDRYHGVEEIPADMARQAVLERAGWQFVRVRGTRYYRNPRETMAWVFEELKNRGVEPADLPAEAQVPETQACDFRDRVVRRAREIMREHGWIRDEALGLNELTVT